MSQDIKVSQNRVLEIIFNEKLIKKRKDENYVLSPQKNKKIVFIISK